MIAFVLEELRVAWYTPTRNHRGASAKGQRAGKMWESRRNLGGAGPGRAGPRGVEGDCTPAEEQMGWADRTSHPKRDREQGCCPVSPALLGGSPPGHLLGTLIKEHGCLKNTLCSHNVNVLDTLGDSAGTFRC